VPSNGPPTGTRLITVFPFHQGLHRGAVRGLVPEWSATRKLTLADSSRLVGKERVMANAPLRCYREQILACGTGSRTQLASGS